MGWRLCCKFSCWSTFCIHLLKSSVTILMKTRINHCCNSTHITTNQSWAWTSHHRTTKCLCITCNRLSLSRSTSLTSTTRKIAKLIYLLRAWYMNNTFQSWLLLQITMLVLLQIIATSTNCRCALYLLVGLCLINSFWKTSTITLIMLMLFLKLLLRATTASTDWSLRSWHSCRGLLIYSIWLIHAILQWLISKLCVKLLWEGYFLTNVWQIWWWLLTRICERNWVTILYSTSCTACRELTIILINRKLSCRGCLTGWGP